MSNVSQRRSMRWIISLPLALCLMFIISGQLRAQAFPDAHETPPTGWTGPVFKLRQDYPTALPAPETLPWATIDFKTEPEKYIKAVLAYALEGNVEHQWEL